MNAPRLALSALSISLFCAAAVIGCADDVDEPEAPAKAQAAASAGYGFEMIPASLHDQASAQPAATPDEVAGRLPPEMVRDVVRGGFGALAACDTAPRARDAKRETTVRFVIAPSGEVKSATTERTTGADAAMEACVRGAVSSLRFPRSHGGDAEVVYPLIF